MIDLWMCFPRSTCLPWYTYALPLHLINKLLLSVSEPTLKLNKNRLNFITTNDYRTFPGILKRESELPEVQNSNSQTPNVDILNAKKLKCNMLKAEMPKWKAGKTKKTKKPRI